MAISRTMFIDLALELFDHVSLLLYLCLQIVGLTSMCDDTPNFMAEMAKQSQNAFLLGLQESLTVLSIQCS